MKAGWWLFVVWLGRGRRHDPAAAAATGEVPLDVAPAVGGQTAVDESAERFGKRAGVEA